jgi:hypothetical protein
MGFLQFLKQLFRTCEWCTGILFQIGIGIIIAIGIWFILLRRGPAGIGIANGVAKYYMNFAFKPAMTWEKGGLG